MHPESSTRAGPSRPQCPKRHATHSHAHGPGKSGGVCAPRSTELGARTRREVLDHLTGDVVMVLHWRGLHEVGGRTVQWAANTAVERQLGTTNSVDDYAGRIGGVPDFDLELDVEGNVTEIPALEPDICPFSVVEPADVVGWARHVRPVTISRALSGW